MTGGIDDRRREEGERLLEALGRSGVEVHAALWAFRPALGEWRLVIATPEVARRGPRAVIRVINHEIVKANGHLSFDLFDVEIFDPQNPDLINLFNVINKAVSLKARNVTLMENVFEQIEVAGLFQIEVAGLYLYFIEEDRIFANGQLTDQAREE